VDIVDDALLTAAETAHLLRLSVRTLEANRLHGVGPRYVKLGRSVRYRLSDVLQHISERVVTSTSETPACAVREARA
jgi:predicted DNA-binding transcriptional regulator AlpA